MSYWKQKTTCAPLLDLSIGLSLLPVQISQLSRIYCLSTYITQYQAISHLHYILSDAWLVLKVTASNSLVKIKAKFKLLSPPPFHLPKIQPYVIQTGTLKTNPNPNLTTTNNRNYSNPALFLTILYGSVALFTGYLKNNRSPPAAPKRLKYMSLKNVSNHFNTFIIFFKTYISPPFYYFVL